LPVGHTPHGPPLLALLALLALCVLLPVEPDVAIVPPPDELAAATPPVPPAVLVDPTELLLVPPAPPAPNIRSGAPHPRNVAAASGAKSSKVRMLRSYGARSPGGSRRHGRDWEVNQAR
jgi:hypothetical protein